MITYRQEIPSAVTPSRLFKAFILDSHNVLPKIVPEMIRRVELIEGNGGVGSIKKTNFGQNFDNGYAKYKIDDIDEGSFYCKYTMIESNIMLNRIYRIDKLEKEVTFVAAGDRCVCKMIIEYHVKDLKQADINRDKARAERFFKAVEDYLLANPRVCA